MKKAAANLLLILSISYFAVISSWYICYSNDFYYPLAYVTADIGGQIQKRAQSDRRYTIFASADSGQGISLFHNLLKRIENGGEGLGKLTYTDSDGNRRLFLDSAEAESLSGMSDMLNFVKRMYRPFLLLVVLVCAYMVTAKVRTCSWRQTARTLSYVFTAFTAVLYFYGFDKFLNFLHKSIFGVDSEFLFRSGKGLLSLIIPYPSMYVFLWCIFLITALGSLGLLYLVCGTVVNAFIGKKYL